MLKINKKLSKKGFSLIELMVAVVILALAIFGIFHAYSVGFMGMADARDRTVATNYLREAMEDIKNKDFDQIITQSRTLISVSGKKYEREVIVDDSVTNLKKVTSKVYWKDRNGNPKMVETSMAIHFIETTAEAPVKIILYANPYNVLTQDITTDTDPENNIDETKSTITAVVKDDKGNTVTDTVYSISFSITQVLEYANGAFSENSKNTIDGKAITTFTSSGGEGEVTITASAIGLTPDSVTIKITNPDEPVKINLTANPIFMTATTSSTSEITASIVNAGGTTVLASKEITFSVSGPGTLSTPTTLSTVDEYGNPTGIATITLTSNGTPGTITVTASSTDLEPGVVDVITGGNIYLSASLTSVPVNETSTITVTTRDVNGVQINYIGTIELSVDNTAGSGTLSSGNFIEGTYKLTFNGDSSSETVIFTATSEGEVNIKAIDLGTILTDSTPLSLTVIEALTPNHIEVYAIPLSIPAGGTETSLITAKVKDYYEVTITSYIGSVNFTTTAGTFPDDVTSFNTNFVDGIATAVLTPTIEADTATIKVCSPSAFDCEIWGETTVGFYIGPDHILLSAVPQKLSVGGQSCILTAKIVDYNGNVISDYNKDITFIISPWPDTIKFAKATTYILTQKVKKGIATVILVSGSEAGTAVIDAYSGDVSGTLNIPVGISLTLVENSVEYTFDTNTNIGIVSFDIMIAEKPLTLEEMQVSWDFTTDETLNKIEIKSPSIVDSIIVYDTNTDFPDSPASSGELIDVTDSTLSIGTSNVKMYFNADMSGKNILDVTFNPNSGDYTVNLIE